VDSILYVVDPMGEEEAVCSGRAVVREGRDAVQWGHDVSARPLVERYPLHSI
jgi:hypothetical protein